MDRETLKALIAQKDAIEREIMEVSDALSSSTNLGGVETPLVDREGFPRADIDIHTTRTLRNKLATLNTDHKALMARIESGLLNALPATSTSSHQPTGGHGERAGAPLAPGPTAPPRPATVAASAASAAGSTGVQSAATGATPPPSAPPTGPSPMEIVDPADSAFDDALVPFAEIDEVAPDGPAAAAGVQAGDELLLFGHVHARNHDGLKALARLTQRSAGGTIDLLVSRGGGNSGGDQQAPQEQQQSGRQRLRLQLMPRRWAGQGLLGCHLRPM